MFHISSLRNVFELSFCAIQLLINYKNEKNVHDANKQDFTHTSKNFVISLFTIEMLLHLEQISRSLGQKFSVLLNNI